MSDPSLDPDFIRFVVQTYAFDPNGYRRDILKMDSDTWQDKVSEALVRHRYVAVSSGHGVGKTTLAASLIHWFMATRPHPACVATANTETQVKKRLWRELRKVNSRAVNRAWFTMSDDTFTFMGDNTAQAVAIPWRENNAEAFAGTHEEHVLGVFDEASAIPEIIWTTFSGAMSTENARWLVIGNPTKPNGKFYEVCHGRDRALTDGDLERGKWCHFVVPSWESKWVDRKWIAEMRSTFGEESDQWRVRVAGLPPRFSEDAIIPSYFVTAAIQRKIEMFERWPLVLGVDVGHRHDSSVIVPRRGRIVPDRIRRVNEMRITDFARFLAEEIRWWRGEHGLDPEVCIEYVGIGVGVVETLEDMGYQRVHGIMPGEPAAESSIAVNVRAEMWMRMRDWFENGCSIPHDDALVADLANVSRQPTGDGRFRVMSKDVMRAKGIPSPDTADALALTFAIDFDLLPDRPDGDRWRSDSYRDVPALEGGGLSWMSL